MKNFFSDWDYKKHAKLVTGIYLAAYAIDMTLGYIIAKKTIDKVKEIRKKRGHLAGGNENEESI